MKKEVTSWIAKYQCYSCNKIQEEKIPLPLYRIDAFVCEHCDMLNSIESAEITVFYKGG